MASNKSDKVFQSPMRRISDTEREKLKKIYMYNARKENHGIKPCVIIYGERFSHSAMFSLYGHIRAKLSYCSSNSGSQLMLHQPQTGVVFWAGWRPVNG